MRSCSQIKPRRNGLSRAKQSIRSLDARSVLIRNATDFKLDEIGAGQLGSSSFATHYSHRSQSVSVV